MIQLQTGDRILVNSDSKLSKLIQYFMRKWAKKKGLNAEYTYSHAGTVVLINTQRPRRSLDKRFNTNIMCYIAESVENGFRLRDINTHYDITKDDIMIVRNKVGIFNGDYEADVLKYALYLQEVNNFYQYWGLLQWAILVTTGINLFGKGNKFSNYCYEGAYRIAKHVRPVDFPKNPEIVTCYDLYDPERDEIVYINKPKTK